MSNPDPDMYRDHALLDEQPFDLREHLRRYIGERLAAMKAEARHHALYEASEAMLCMAAAFSIMQREHTAKRKRVRRRRAAAHLCAAAPMHMRAAQAYAAAADGAERTP